MKVAAAIAALVMLVALPVIALGHAELISSDPPAGGILTTTPYTLTATFDDELTADGSSITIENSSGSRVAQGTVSADDEHVMAAELPALPDGEYTVRWTAVSADDAAVERGTYTFNVGGVTVSPPPGSTSGDTVPSGYEVAVALALAAILIGAVIFLVLRRRS